MRFFRDWVQRKNSTIIDFVWRFSSVWSSVQIWASSQATFWLTLSTWIGHETSLLNISGPNVSLQTSKWNPWKLVRMVSATSLNGWDWIIHASFCWKYSDDMFWQFSTEATVILMQQITLNIIHNNLSLASMQLYSTFVITWKKRFNSFLSRFQRSDWSFVIHCTLWLHGFLAWVRYYHKTIAAFFAAIQQQQLRFGTLCLAVKVLGWRESFCNPLLL